jgi:YidC/Oxa1 family membrane protein insertase
VIRWVGVRSKYFLLALVPKVAPDGVALMSRARGEEAIASGLRVPLGLDGPTVYEFELYAGPMQYHLLEQLRAELERAMDLGWKIVVPFTRLLLVFFQAVHRAVPNYGLVIIILSAVVKLVFYPLTRKSMESMRQMQLLKPEMDRLNEKYKDDPQRKNQAVLELYRKHKVNPLGGCLPVLVQMPVFVALYSALNTAIELRKAPFTLWIHDLSAPDRIGSIVGMPIHVLPLIMAGTMIWQQKLTPTDPRQAAMAYMMPVIMTVFFYAMPSGLVLYWTVTNLMAVAQQIWMNRTIRQQSAAA